MSDADSALPDSDPQHAPADAAAPWRQLPPNARRLFMLSGLLVALPAAIVGRLMSRIFDFPFGWTTSLVIAVVGSVLGAWLGHRRYRHTRWRLDADGLSLRKGRMWQSEIRVPINRVQHLDLRRGPLERRYGLSTLVVHTAGTRDSSVNFGGLAEDDAEYLRDLLARQHEHDA